MSDKEGTIPSFFELVEHIEEVLSTNDYVSKTEEDYKEEYEQIKKAYDDILEQRYAPQPVILLDDCFYALLFFPTGLIEDYIKRTNYGGFVLHEGRYHFGECYPGGEDSFYPNKEDNDEEC